ncbi:hypothetical protein CROQUDRAFT_443266 [Cronartium quercuum f. sp. fusiforme G11]|uniref:Uncharacterized protein n=1 Tax=Cronartium quercuum f. sp. fusiforme G11 TaxID=708437 RepID=A0A9P6NKS3_9BASI|nr:hypothetical protein CROQUDRAFT_443266 [Cronartium quercuum f. sp. fusiforme G11]
MKPISDRFEYSNLELHFWNTFCEFSDEEETLSSPSLSHSASTTAQRVSQNEIRFGLKKKKKKKKKTEKLKIIQEKVVHTDYTNTDSSYRMDTAFLNRKPSVINNGSSSISTSSLDQNRLTRLEFFKLEKYFEDGNKIYKHKKGLRTTYTIFG